MEPSRQALQGGQRPCADQLQLALELPAARGHRARRPKAASVACDIMRFEAEARAAGRAGAGSAPCPRRTPTLSSPMELVAGAASRAQTAERAPARSASMVSSAAAPAPPQARREGGVLGLRDVKAGEVHHGRVVAVDARRPASMPGELEDCSCSAPPRRLAWPRRSPPGKRAPASSCAAYRCASSGGSAGQPRLG